MGNQYETNRRKTPKLSIGSALHLIEHTCRDRVDETTHPPLSICFNERGGGEGEVTVGNPCEYDSLELDSSLGLIFISSLLLNLTDGERTEQIDRGGCK